ncbi:hypothetical protein ACJX0J_033844, partial [Zea mays]
GNSIYGHDFLWKSCNIYGYSLNFGYSAMFSISSSKAVAKICLQKLERFKPCNLVFGRNEVKIPFTILDKICFLYLFFTLIPPMCVIHIDSASAGGGGGDGIIWFYYLLVEEAVMHAVYVEADLFDLAGCSCGALALSVQMNEYAQ